MVLPNIFLNIYVYINDLNRVLINFDYCFLYLFFYFLFLIDLFFILYQYFPFIKINDLIYLASFIFHGPREYIYLLLFSLFVIIFLYYVVVSYIKSSWYSNLEFSKISLFFLNIIFFCLLLNLLLDDSKWKIWGDVEFKFGKSQVVVFYNNFNNTYNQITNKKELLELASYEGATNDYFKKNYIHQSKVLLIVNESWGFPREIIGNEILKNIRTKKYKSYEEGKLKFIGATVSGELRELCKLNTRSFSLRLAETGFENCLPNYFKSIGYKTYAFHGAMGNLYDRNYWYPKAGFDEILTFEKLNQKNLRKCKSFSGICDEEIFPIIKEKILEDDKVFLYWLTLKTHVPYKDEIKDSRFECVKLKIPSDSETCRWAMLQTDFFDRLAKMLDDPAMRDIDVIVVGDHATPIFNLGESIQYFKNNNEVSYLKFKL